MYKCLDITKSHAREKSRNISACASQAQEAVIKTTYYFSNRKAAIFSEVGVDEDLLSIKQLQIVSLNSITRET